jgi:phosphoribosylanthranilate isomerase
MGFIVKNPPKRSVSLKNALEEKKVKFNVKKLILIKVKSKAEYIRRVEDEKSSP